jgi:hypothetical protein
MWQVPGPVALAAVQNDRCARQIVLRRHGVILQAESEVMRPKGWRPLVNLRFFVDLETGEPHIWGHGITEDEVRETLRAPYDDRAGREGARVALGQTVAGRYLRVVYVQDVEPDSAFVITAYEIGPKARKALRRRWRKRS